MYVDDEYNEEMTEKMSKAEKEAYGDYNGKCRAERDLETLTEAQEVKRDKKRFKRAVYCGNQKMKDLKKVTDED